MAILLPPNENLNKFYKFGPTADNTSPHWYDFSFDKDAGTGAQFVGTVTMKSPSGVGIQKTLVIIHYIDGQRGDDDLDINGTILNSESGLSFSRPSTDSGSLAYITLLILLIINMCRYGAMQKMIRRIL